MKKRKLQTNAWAKKTNKKKAPNISVEKMRGGQESGMDLPSNIKMIECNETSSSLPD